MHWGSGALKLTESGGASGRLKGEERDKGRRGDENRQGQSLGPGLPEAIAPFSAQTESAWRLELADFSVQVLKAHFEYDHLVTLFGLHSCPHHQIALY